ncbi:MULTISPECIES: hypothetical protein [Streptomyces]|uniref:hypothetical protein n=1 Tax=Streptomyces TaxID=1883 RepID=UPI001590D994|nr:MULTISPECIES: hypothetical protein [Streptomyces]QKV68141.1 hypothetical protein HUT13_04645 [Streptomyces harbinensis]
MVALRIHDVPETVRDMLAARTRENSQCLPEAFCSGNLDLIRELDDASAQPGPSVEDILAALDDARAERGQAFGDPGTTPPTSPPPRCTTVRWSPRTPGC